MAIFPQALNSEDVSSLREPTSGCIALNTGISINVIWLCNKDKILNKVIQRANHHVFTPAL